MLRCLPRDQDHPHGKEMQKSKMAVLGGLTNSCEKKRSKKQRRKGKILHLNAEFQRIAKRNKKAFLSNQCKEIEENNRMGKTGDLFKKIRDTKGTSHAKMSTIYVCVLVTQSCPTLCDPMNRSTPGLPVHHQLLEFTETHVHRVGLGRPYK